MQVHNKTSERNLKRPFFRINNGDTPDLKDLKKVSSLGFKKSSALQWCISETFSLESVILYKTLLMQIVLVFTHSMKVHTNKTPTQNSFLHVLPSPQQTKHPAKGMMQDSLAIKTA